MRDDLLLRYATPLKSVVQILRKENLYQQEKNKETNIGKY